MSTKIYKGFQVATSSAVTLLQLVEAVRPWCQAQADALMYRFVEAAKTDPVSALQLWMKVHAKSKEQGLRAPGVNTDFELVFFPDGERFLGIGYTEHRPWFDYWLAQPGVSDYAYWSNSDAPDDVPQEEWEQRASDWNRVLGYGIPAMKGFTLQVTDPNGPMPDFSRIKALCPPPVPPVLPSVPKEG